ncbi:M28 family peptidase, partial [Escherichia coli]|nr:M28 family peptidase [Escherichia coli]
DGFGPSDHASFYARRIPVLFFWTGTHEDYHKPSDTADKINYVGQTQIALFVAEIAREIDRLPQRPTYAVVRGETNMR